MNLFILSIPMVERDVCERLQEVEPKNRMEEGEGLRPRHLQFDACTSDSDIPDSYPSTSSGQNIVHTVVVLGEELQQVYAIFLGEGLLILVKAHFLQRHLLAKATVQAF
tara:strand:- start:66 stop:392 length:327 start_codon:yes stop_codon:yes gene_type:complete